MRKPPTGMIAAADLAPVGRRRPNDGAVFEMHAHSAERSRDSGVRAINLVSQAAARRLDGICLTEHNALWPASEMTELSERFGVIVLGGMELGTDAGHVLVYGLDRYRPELLQLERLRRIVESDGAAMVLAHPMRPFHGIRPDWSELPSWFDGVEVINGDHSDSEDGYLVRQAAHHRLGAIGGSDAHTHHAVARVGTTFPRCVLDLGALVHCIRNRTTVAVDFRPRPGSVK